jgi:hypothetical protein
MSVVPPHGGWSVVNEPLEFVGRQEMVLLHVRSLSTIDAVSEREFPLRLGDLGLAEIRYYRRSRNLPCNTATCLIGKGYTTYALGRWGYLALTVASPAQGSSL